MGKEVDNGIKNFAWPVTSVNREDYDAFFSWFDSHQDIINAGIVVWGAGIRGSEFACYFSDYKIKNVVYTDSNENKWEGYINEYKILPPAEIIGNKKKYPYVLISVENSEKICTILEANGYQKNLTYFTIETTLYEKYIDQFRNMEGKEYLFMGDCEFSKVSIHDECKVNLGEMLIGQLNGLAGVLAMHGMGLRSHYTVLQELIAQNKIPHKLCLMVNFDTLTGKQHLLPRAQHEPLFRTLVENEYAATSEFKNYWQITKERSQNIQSEMFVESENSLFSDKDQKSRIYFKLNYMYSLNMEIEGIEYLKKTIQLCNHHNIWTVLFIPPVNYEYAEKLFGARFMERYSANLSKIHELAELNKVKLLDFSFSLSSEEFAEKDTPDETMNYYGRKKISEILIKTIGSKEIAG